MAADPERLAEWDRTVREPLGAAIDKLFVRKNPSWLELVGPVLQRQREEKAEEDRQFARYTEQRDMGLRHDVIARFYTCKTAEHFEGWYADARRPA